jgi:hypothetical protein
MLFIETEEGDAPLLKRASAFKNFLWKVTISVNLLVRGKTWASDAGRITVSPGVLKSTVMAMMSNVGRFRVPGYCEVLLESWGLINNRRDS